MQQIEGVVVVDTASAAVALSSSLRVGVTVRNVCGVDVDHFICVSFFVLVTASSIKKMPNCRTGVFSRVK